MQQEIQLNIIPFTATVEKAEFAFYTAKQDGYCPTVDKFCQYMGLQPEKYIHYNTSK